MPTLKGTSNRAAQTYDGPRHTRITRKLRKIAKAHGLRLWFKPSIDSYCGEYLVGDDRAIVVLDRRSDVVISTFFHELGHHLDFKNGLFPSFYDLYAPLYKQRLIALKAERHADKTGQKLCKKYFPKIKYDKSYISEEDLDFHRKYYADGRKRLTTTSKSSKVKA